ncbi:hypothetical protein C3B79_0091 [Aeromonas hydrophila]|nr:hypothetical protein C3B79_0091 [Aeromonas hydrophila]
MKDSIKCLPKISLSHSNISNLYVLDENIIHKFKKNNML